MTKIISCREFNQDVSGAKRLAEKGPVVITDRGKPAYVLMKHDAYERMTDTGPTILDLLAHPASEDFDFDFDPEPLDGSRIKAAKLS